MAHIKKENHCACFMNQEVLHANGKFPVATMSIRDKKIKYKKPTMKIIVPINKKTESHFEPEFDSMDISSGRMPKIVSVNNLAFVSIFNEKGDLIGRRVVPKTTLILGKNESFVKYIKSAKLIIDKTNKRVRLDGKGYHEWLPIEVIPKPREGHKFYGNKYVKIPA
jgi:hypothetical protein